MRIQLILAHFFFLSYSLSHQLPPPLSSLTGIPRYIDGETRDVPAITNFWGSVGSSSSDVVGLSQVMLPPFLDVGVPTALLSTSDPTPSACSPENTGAWTIADTYQYFNLISENITMKLYNLTCNTSCSSSWHTASATMPSPFNTFHIVYHMQPGFNPFEDDGVFDESCTVINYRKGGQWCASQLNPSCTPETKGILLEGWQWTPTGILRWGGPATSETRMLFEGNGVLQRVHVSAGTSDLNTVSLQLTGAVQSVLGMGWVTEQIGNTNGYTSQIISVGGNNAVSLLTCNTLTLHDCALWIISSSNVDFNATLQTTTMSLLFSKISAGESLDLELALVVGTDQETVLELAASLSDSSGFIQAWDEFSNGWEERWLDAFTPKPFTVEESISGHYSGSLPVLQLDESSTGTAISKLYYMGCFAILQAERTNLPLVSKRVYVTGTGNELCGIAVGGTEQWAWDQTFYGSLQALLDPEAVSDDLKMWVGQPINQLTGITLDDVTIQGGWYAYNAISLYRTYSTYLRITGDMEFLEAKGTGSGSSNETVDMMLDVLADNYLRFCLPNSTLADYDSSPARYLECVPTYIHVTAGLQGGNSFMALDLADLRQAQGNITRSQELKERALQIGIETIQTLFVSNTSGKRGGNSSGDIGGWFSVFDTSTKGSVEVRHIVDFAYLPFGLCSPRWPPCALNSTVAEQMSDFFIKQLVIPSGAWTRALSLLDDAAPVERPDHGSTGAYAAWPAMAFDALTSLSGFTKSLEYLSNIRGADEGPFGQAHGITSDGSSVFKTTGGCNRYIANNGASFAESVLRVIFGYEPVYFTKNDPSPILSNVSRNGLLGTLTCIRGPSIGGAAPRFATATLTSVGVTYLWSDVC
jgi:hypothetical protein